MFKPRLVFNDSILAPCCPHWWAQNLECTFCGGCITPAWTKTKK